MAVAAAAVDVLPPLVDYERVASFETEVFVCDVNIVKNEYFVCLSHLMINLCFVVKYNDFHYCFYRCYHYYLDLFFLHYYYC